MEQTKEHPTLEQILKEIGEVGDWLTHLKACEGASGNISVCMDWGIDPSLLFPVVQQMELPVYVPDLVGKSILITGSGTRLRQLYTDPLRNMGFLKINYEGRTGTLFTHPEKKFTRLTSELNSHLSLHQREMGCGEVKFNAIVHAQPIYLTYLTSIPEYQDSVKFSQAIFRWQPEMVMNFPGGLAFIPFEVPNSNALMEATKGIDKSQKLIVWAKHGVLAISNQSVTKALDMIEYAETGAHYEYLNQANQNRAEGLSKIEIGAICEFFQLDGSVLR